MSKDVLKKFYFQDIDFSQYRHQPSHPIPLICLFGIGQKRPHLGTENEVLDHREVSTAALQ